MAAAQRAAANRTLRAKTGAYGPRTDRPHRTERIFVLGDCGGDRGTIKRAEDVHNPGWWGKLCGSTHSSPQGD